MRIKIKTPSIEIEISEPENVDSVSSRLFSTYKRNETDLTDSELTTKCIIEIIKCLFSIDNTIQS